MKTRFLIVLALALFAGRAISQSSAEQFPFKNALKISPFGFGNSEFQMSYERYFGENRRSCLMLAPSIILKESNDITKEGWQAMAQYRFFLTHFNKQAQHTFLGVYNYGFYAGLYGQYGSYGEDYQRGYYDPATTNYLTGKFRKEVDAVEGGALLGLQADITKRIVIDFYVGGGIKHANFSDTYLDQYNPEYTDSYGVFDPEYSGVKPKIGFLIGFTF